MDCQEAIKFIDEIIELHQSPPWVFPLNSEEDLKLVKALLWRGERYEKMVEVLVERYGYAYVHKLVDKSVAEVSQVREIMAKLKAEFFGSSPKSKHQRLNKVIDRLGIYMQVGKMSEIIKSLVELRDEEEDV